MIADEVDLANVHLVSSSGFDVVPNNGSVICVKVASRPSDSRLSRSSMY